MAHVGAFWRKSQGLANGPGVNYWLERLAAFFYPEVCQICQAGYASRAQGYICLPCQRRPGAIKLLEAPYCDRCGLPFAGQITGNFTCSNCDSLDLAFSSARAALILSKFLLEVIHRYKYQRATWFEPFLADHFLRVAGPVCLQEQVDLIVPIPLHPLKKRERGFNQAERLGSRLSKNTGISFNAHLLHRKRPTKSQTFLSRQERSNNMNGAFAYQGIQPLNGERVVLVDDILTTGATCSACAVELLKNGASEVKVWTVARNTGQH